MGAGRGAVGEKSCWGKEGNCIVYRRRGLDYW